MGVGALVAGAVVGDGALDVGPGGVGGLPVAGVVGGVTGGVTDEVTDGVVGFDPVGVTVGGTTGGVVDDAVAVVVGVSVVDEPLPHALAKHKPASRLASNVNLNSRTFFITSHDVAGPAGANRATDGEH